MKEVPCFQMKEIPSKSMSKCNVNEILVVEFFTVADCVHVIRGTSAALHLERYVWQCSRFIPCVRH